MVWQCNRAPISPMLSTSLAWQSLWFHFPEILRSRREGQVWRATENQYKTECVTEPGCWILMSLHLLWVKGLIWAAAHTFIIGGCSPNHRKLFTVWSGTWREKESDGFVHEDYLLGLIICLSFWVQHSLSLSLHGFLPILLRLQRQEREQLCGDRSHDTSQRVELLW